MATRLLEMAISLLEILAWVLPFGLAILALCRLQENYREIWDAVRRHAWAIAVVTAFFVFLIFDLLSDIRSSISVKPHDGYNYPRLEILASDGSRKLVAGRFPTVRTETSRNSVSTSTNRAATIFFKSILVFIIRRRCLLAEQCYNHSPYWTNLAPCPRKEYSHEA